MKKIMFNDKFLLTQAVLEGRKTQTRRLIKCRKTFKGEWVAGFNIHIRPSDKKVVGLPCMYDADESEFDGGEILPKYNVGEVVAVAQSYCSIADELEDLDNATCAAHYEKNIEKAQEYLMLMEHPGFYNKMFVGSSKMIHQIRITNVRVEKLQDISEQDAIAEGITYVGLTHDDYGEPMFVIDGCKETFSSARDAYACLIDKISGKGTWASNPYVFVYDFRLIK